MWAQDMRPLHMLDVGLIDLGYPHRPASELPRLVHIFHKHGRLPIHARCHRPDEIGQGKFPRLARFHIQRRDKTVIAEFGVQAARAWLEPIRDHLSDAGLGTISEIFDGAPPISRAARRPKPGRWPVCCKPGSS